VCATLHDSSLPGKPIKFVYSWIFVEGFLCELCGENSLPVNQLNSFIRGIFVEGLPRAEIFPKLRYPL